ncbi:hypothetical protein NM208_g13960 [Fusarium decemcellulare]|uniref:Uncharacterized protein n=1 Tax=Fusarium decemcellulare TaxID=57161 RepID=A0ACC1RHT5_9HYPO|nr:hypothetical protein NM208_g13960 [Fusarium decemcellulare]
MPYQVWPDLPKKLGFKNWKELRRRANEVLEESEKERLERAEERFLAHGPIGSAPRETQTSQAVPHEKVAHETVENEQAVADHQGIRERDEKQTKDGGLGSLDGHGAENQGSKTDAQSDQDKQPCSGPSPSNKGDLN